MNFESRMDTLRRALEFSRVDPMMFKELMSLYNMGDDRRYGRVWETNSSIRLNARLAEMRAAGVETIPVKVRSRSCDLFVTTALCRVSPSRTALDRLYYDANEEGPGSVEILTEDEAAEFEPSWYDLTDAY